VYSRWFDYAILALIAAAIGFWVAKKVRKRRRAATDN
jgi:hypothetical protein